MFYFSYFLFSLIGLLSYFVSVYFLFLLIPVALLTYYWTRSKKLVIIGLIFAIIFLIIGWIFPKGIETKENITGIVIQRKETYYLILTTKGKYLVFDNSDINLFSVVELSGYSSKLLFSHYEQGFNFKEYLNSQGVYYAYNVDQAKIIFKSLSISKPIQEWISKFLNTNSTEIVNSLLFGQGISSEKKELLNIYSLTSIFSLSGLHISFLIRIISNLTKARLKKKNDYVITTILFAFLFTSGFKFTIRRIFLFYLIKTVSSHMFKKHLYSVEILSISCIVMFIFEPYIVLSTSFYYSFPFLFFLRLFPIKAKGIKGYISFLLQLTLFYLPYKLLSDYQISFLGIILQLVLSPFTIIIFLLSLLLIVPYVGFVINIVVDLILKILTIGTNINIVFVSGKIHAYQVIIYYFLLFLCLSLYHYKYKFHSKEIGVVLSLVTSSFFVPDYLYHYEVHFVDVDQGDCTLVRNRHCIFLIDTGGIVGKDLAKECLVPYFNKLKITQLDYVIITHQDYDHYGALESLENIFKVKKVLYVEDFISNKNTYYIDNLIVHNLNFYDLNLTRDKNYHSGVYKFDIKNNSFLIMGDAPKEIEYKIINDNSLLNIDYLKVGHHGSKTSTSEELVKHLLPKEAIISCGEKNRYKFPHSEVIDVLKKYNVKIRRTDLEGTIVYKFT